MGGEFAREDDCRILLVFDPKSPAASATPQSNARESFERAVTFCAALASNFHERDALLEFRSADASTPPAPASENIFAILLHLTLVHPIAPTSRPALMTQLAPPPDSVN